MTMMAVIHQKTSVMTMLLIKLLLVMSGLSSSGTTTSSGFFLPSAFTARPRVVGRTTSSTCSSIRMSPPTLSSRSSSSSSPSSSMQKRTVLPSRRSSVTTSTALSLSSSSSMANKSDNTDDDDELASLSFISPLNEYVSAFVLILLDVLFRRAFRQAQIAFPSSLAACCILFTSLLLCPQRNLANATVRVLFQPGAALLSKWLPVFFVPSLVVLPLLPLQDALGSTAEVSKVVFVLVGGFFWTLLTTSMSVVSVRKRFASSASASDNDDSVDRQEKKENNEKSDASKSKNDLQEVALQAVRYAESRRGSSTTRGPFSDQLFAGLLTATAGSGLAAIFFSLLRFKFLSFPLTSLYLLSATLGSFVFGTRLPQKFCKVVHPLITCGCLTWVASAVLAKLIPGSTVSFRAVLKAYMKGSLTWTGGAGDLLLFMLGPAVVSLSISMYDKRRLMRQNLKEVATAVGVSTIGGIFGTALLVRILQIANPSLRLALLSRNITSPLAMAIAAIVGADASMAVAAVVLTGIFGANFGASILNAFSINDPVARGLGIGAAAHGLGTASFVNEKDAFPFAAIAMALTATAATVTVSIPLLRRIILQLALG